MIKRAKTKLSIAKLITVYILITLLVMLLMSVSFYIGLDTQHGALTEISKKSFPSYAKLVDINQSMLSTNARVYKLVNLIYAGEKIELTKAMRSDIDKGLTQIEAEVKALENKIGSEGDASLKALQASMTEYKNTMGDALNTAALDVSAGAMVLLGAETTFQSIEKSLEERMILAQKTATTSFSSANAYSEGKDRRFRRNPTTKSGAIDHTRSVSDVPLLS